MTDNSGNYKIVAGSYRINAGGVVLPASHNFWMLQDSNGETIAELHGLATNEDGYAEEWGDTNEKLKFYHLPDDSINGEQYIPMFHDSEYVRDTEVVFEGDIGDVVSKWSDAVSEIGNLNDKDYDYSDFGFLGDPVVNSNSAYRKFGDLMGVEYHNFSWVLEPGLDTVLPDEGEPYRENAPDTLVDDFGIDFSVNKYFNIAKNWILRKDPMTFDLDGDGLETVGIDSENPLLFDHNGDGVSNATGWISPDDGFLVLDRNGNGVIDDGTELFGDSTPILNEAGEVVGKAER